MPERFSKELSKISKQLIAELPQDTVEWLEENNGVKIKSPFIYFIPLEDMTMHYSYDYLMNTPLGEIRAKYEKHFADYEARRGETKNNKKGGI